MVVCLFGCRFGCLFGCGMGGVWSGWCVEWVMCGVGGVWSGWIDAFFSKVRGWNGLKLRNFGGNY